MEIGKYKYKGFEYEVIFTAKGDWRENKNKFQASNGLFSTEYHKEFEKCKSEFESIVDDFLKKQPKNIDDLCSKLGELLVWTGYEDCHFDEKAAKILINGYIESLKKC